MVVDFFKAFFLWGDVDQGDACRFLKDIQCHEVPEECGLDSGGNEGKMRVSDSCGKLLWLLVDVYTSNFNSSNFSLWFFRFRYAATKTLSGSQHFLKKRSRLLTCYTPQN